MRRLRFAVLLASSLAVAACSSTSGTDVLAIPGTSNETTASVKRPTESIAAGANATDAVAAAVEAADAPAPVTALADPAPDAVPLKAIEGAMATASAIRDGKVRAVKQTIYGYNFRDAKPINFGKVSPRKFAVHGVDVSRWQGDIDWAKLRTQGANFAYIKATDGGDHLDPMFKTNWRGAHAAGSAVPITSSTGAGRRQTRPSGSSAMCRRSTVPCRRSSTSSGTTCRTARSVRRARWCWRRCASSWTVWRGTTASAR
jgi:lysozyme